MFDLQLHGDTLHGQFCFILHRRSFLQDGRRRGYLTAPMDFHTVADLPSLPNLAQITFPERAGAAHGTDYYPARRLFRCHDHEY